MLRVAVDVGGTFTDVLAADDATGQLYALKVKSTPKAPEEGFIGGLSRLLLEHRFKPADLDSIIHVSTVGTNLLSGQVNIRVPRVALLTTRGFRDVIEIGRQNRSELYNLFFQRPNPLVPRRLRFEVSERVDASGEVITPVNMAELGDIAAKLRGDGVESVAVSFINSYLNPINENVAKEALMGRLGIETFVSSEVDPEHREYERTSTTVVNAVLAPVVSRYLESAKSRLIESGTGANLYILSSSGGLVDVEEVRRKPIVAVESGPTAGVVGAAEMARQLGYSHIISLDMGGTTAKAGCVVDYLPLTVSEVEVAGRVHLGRITKGSGYPVRYPCVDLAEVSAGGGTIIWGDEAGAVRVGPISAGADPGPACYGSGGEDPTLTDANLHLGRLGVTLTGGEIELDRKLAVEALNRVGEKVGLDGFEVAVTALKLINLQMARAIDIVSLERGLDPRRFILFAFGGAGPMHAIELAEEVGINLVIVPPFPGLFSALGMLMSDMKYSYVTGLLRLLEDSAEPYCEELFQNLREDAEARLASYGVNLANASLRRSVDLRYLGQGYELEAPAPTPFNVRAVASAFESKHEQVYGYKHLGEKIEITALRLTITVPVQKPKLTEVASKSSEVNWERKSEEREVWFKDGWVKTPIYPRDKIDSNRKVSGPSIIEAYDSTVVIPPVWVCKKAALDCLILERESS